MNRDASRSYGDPESPNAVFHAENLAAMKWLARAGFAGRFRCAYLDPPYNSQRRFAEYDDALAPAAWRAMIGDRLAAVRELLAEDGAVFVEIDDTELGALLAAMDDVFGREQRVSTITVVRSAATGHKAINRGPVNVADYLLLYTKNRSTWRCHPLAVPRRRYDAAYSTWHENPGDPWEAWRFVPLAAHLRTVLGRAPSRAEREAFALENAGRVVRFAQPRYEAVSGEARALIDASRADPSRVYRLARQARKDILLWKGNRLLFLADKVTVQDGRPVIVEPLTNVWDDVGFQGIAREGNTRFTRNKKPEKLVSRILALSTEPGDWVLDPFLGSGTTAAVALKMRRRFVGIERGSHIDTMCLPRLRRVVDGLDPAGITRAQRWAGGGGFHVWA